MLEKEQRDPAAFGYDRPSPKLVAFLRKHFGLAEYVPQTNNFIVFDRYFEMPKSSSSSSSSSSNGAVPDFGRRSIGKGPSSLMTSSTSNQQYQQTHVSISRALDSFRKVNSTNNSPSSTTSSNNNYNNNENVVASSSSSMNNNGVVLSAATKAEFQQQQQRLRQMNSNVNNGMIETNPSPQKQIPMPIPQSRVSTSSSIGGSNSFNNNNNNVNVRSVYSTSATTSNQQYGRNAMIIASSNLNQNNNNANVVDSSSKPKLGPLLSSSSSTSNPTTYRSTSDPTSIGLGTSTTCVYQAAIRGNVSTGVGSFGGASRTSAGKFF